MSIFSSYAKVGDKEDISEVIANIAPVDTPFQSTIGTKKTHNKVYQWQSDDLATPGVNAAVEGADADTAVHTPTEMHQNYTQIFTKTIFVSGSNEAIDAYGRNSEIAYQLEKKSKEMKRDLEHSLVGSAQTAVPGDAATARQMSGAQDLIVKGQRGVGNVVDAALGGLTEAVFLEAAAAVYESGGEAKCFMYPSSLADQVAAYNTAEYRTKFTDAMGTEYSNLITVYVDPRGQNIKCVPNRFMKFDNALVFDPEMFSLVDLRPAFTEKLAKTGDAEKYQIVRETTLELKAPLSACLIENVVS